MNKINKFYKEHYLNDTHNIIFLLMIISLEIVLGTLAVSKTIQRWFNDNPLFLGLGWPVVLALIGQVPSLIRKRFELEPNSPIHLFEKPKVKCRRKKYLEEIERLLDDKSNHDIIVIYGESGAGKSTILNMINGNPIIETQYHDGISTNLDKDRVYIYDQFERSIQLDDRRNHIENIVKNAKYNKVIISVRKEYFGDLYQELRESVEDDVSFKVIFIHNEADVDEIIEHFCEQTNLIKKTERVGFSKTSIEDTIEQITREIRDRIDNNASYSEEQTKNLVSFIKGITDIKFVEINALINLIRGYRTEGMDKQGINIGELGDAEKQITRALEDELNKFHDKDLIYSILFLLTRDSKNQHLNRVSDFTNVTFENSKTVLKCISYLEDIGVVQTERGNDSKKQSRVDQPNFEHSSYEIAHDYYAEILKGILLNNMDQRLCGNIQRYYNECSLRRYKGAKESSTRIEWENRSDRINRTKEDLRIIIDNPDKENANDEEANFKIQKLRSYVMGWLYLFGIIIIAGNVFGIIAFKEDYRYVSFVFINANIAFSVYYSYNWFIHFVSRFRDKDGKMVYRAILYISLITCTIPYLGNFIAMVSSLKVDDSIVRIMQNIWAVGPGLCIITGGFVMRSISEGVGGEEKKFFWDRFVTFSFIGGIIVVLGILFDVYTTNSAFLIEIAHYSLYSVYIIMAIYAHINRRYLKILVGKTLYWSNDYWSECM